MKLVLPLLICVVLLMSFKLSSIEGDSKLNDLKNSLPLGWQLMIDGDTLKIENL